MKGRRWSGPAAVLTAAAGSACCWLPVILVVTGVSAAGTASFLEKLRIPFLIGAGLFLALGFYLNYRPPRAACGPGGICETPPERGRLLNRVLLWVSAAAVAAFTLFPDTIPAFVGASAGRTGGTPLPGSACCTPMAEVSAGSVNPSSPAGEWIADVASSLALAAAADDSTRLEPLSADGAELRRRFNRDKDRTRLLMLLAPS